MYRIPLSVITGNTFTIRVAINHHEWLMVCLEGKRNGTHCKGFADFEKITQPVLMKALWQYVDGMLSLAPDISGVTPGAQDKTTKAYCNISLKGNKLHLDTATLAQNISHRVGSVFTVNEDANISLESPSYPAHN